MYLVGRHTAEPKGKAATECAFSRPEAARQAAEGLTRALLDKPLIDGELCIRVFADAMADRAIAHALNVAVISLLMGRVFLAYLRRFPIGKLKIDKSFIRSLPGDDSDAAIVRAVIQMARALNLKVNAEGVETEPQEGCDELQGFLLAAPLDAFSFEQRLRHQAADGRHLRVVSR
jgi:predicted signal transduction protein with EAL and GGDEF domain